MGRLDGRISRANETSLLPAPTASFAQLQQRFNQLNLSVKDLVTLSGTVYIYLHISVLHQLQYQLPDEVYNILILLLFYCDQLPTYPA
jgi:uncharacterized protein YdcH (DUF465 family)